MGGPAREDECRPVDQLETIDKADDPAPPAESVQDGPDRGDQTSEAMDEPTVSIKQMQRREQQAQRPHPTSADGENEWRSTSQVGCAAHTSCTYSDDLAQSIVVIAQPVMSIGVFNDIMERKDQFGWQKGKDRGTAQESTLKKWTGDGSTVGGFVSTVRSWAAAGNGAVRRQFVNINSGDRGAIDEDGEEEGSGPVGHKKVHTDRFWSDLSTHRLLQYYPEPGQSGSIVFVLDDGDEVEYRCPSGCSFLIPRVRLAPLTQISRAPCPVASPSHKQACACPPATGDSRADPARARLQRALHLDCDRGVAQLAAACRERGGDRGGRRGSALAPAT